MYPADHAEMVAFAGGPTDMSTPMTEHARQTFLAEPHIATICVNRPDGRPPLATPSMYAYEPGGDVTFFTGTQGRIARRSALIEKSQALTISVQHDRVPYRYVTAECSLVRVDRPPTPDQMLAVLRRYLPWDAAQGMAAAELGSPDTAVVLYTVRPTRWFSADFSDDAG
jgi:hypothetical protein